MYKHAEVLEGGDSSSGRGRNAHTFSQQIEDSGREMETACEGANRDSWHGDARPMLPTSFLSLRRVIGRAGGVGASSF